MLWLADILVFYEISKWPCQCCSRGIGLMTDFIFIVAYDIQLLYKTLWNWAASKPITKSRVFKTKHFLLFFVGLTGKLFGAFTLTVKLDRRPAGQTAIWQNCLLYQGANMVLLLLGCFNIGVDKDFSLSAPPQELQSLGLLFGFILQFFTLEVAALFVEDQFSDWNFHLVFLVQPCYLLWNQSWSCHLFNLL